MKIIKVSLITMILVGSTLGAKESLAIEGLDVSGTVTFKSNIVWRGKTSSKDSAAIGADLTLKYSGLYIYGGQYSSAREGMGFDLGAGYINSIDNYTYDIGYVNYGWTDNEKSSVKYDDWDQIYFYSNYKIEDLTVGIDFNQRTLSITETTIQLNLAYKINDILAFKTSAGSVIGDNPTRNYAEFSLSKACKITGGEWGLKVGYTDRGGMNGSNKSDTTYAISHGFSF